jgi:hypothetical protein
MVSGRDYTEKVHCKNFDIVYMKSQTKKCMMYLRDLMIKTRAQFHYCI